jgi:hypothetical protein
MECTWRPKKKKNHVEASWRGVIAPWKGIQSFVKRGRKLSKNEEVEK